MTRLRPSLSKVWNTEGSVKARAAALLAMAYDTTLPARDRLAAIEQATALVREVDDGPITFAIDPADEVDETYWNIVLACVNAAAGLVTSARHAHDVVTIAADGYRVIVETRLATQRAEAELAVLARQSKAEKPERHGP